MEEMKIEKNRQEEFINVFKMIKTSQNNALRIVNTELINYIGILENILMKK